MRVAILDDIHDAYAQTAGVRRLRDRIGSTNVEIFTRPFGPPHALAGFDALIANRERTRFSRDLLEQLPDLKIIAQTGNHAYHIGTCGIRWPMTLVLMLAGACFAQASFAGWELPFGEPECEKSGGTWTTDPRLPSPGTYCLFAESRARCEARGGAWTLVRPDKVGCKSTDAGKQCSEAAECQIACVAPRGVRMDDSTVGTCAPDDQLIGVPTLYKRGGKIRGTIGVRP